MKKSSACILAGIILGMSLIVPTNANEISVQKGEVLEMSLEDAQLLMRTAWAEAGDQGEDGIWLVMSVVVNRVNDPEWPDNIHDVVYQAHQFAKPSKLQDVGTTAHTALARIEMGEICPQIIAFEKNDSSGSNQYFDAVFTYRDHTFYAKRATKN